MASLRQVAALVGILAPVLGLRTQQPARLLSELDVSRPHLEENETSGKLPTFVDAFLDEGDRSKAFVILATKHLANKGNQYDVFASSNWHCHWSAANTSATVQLGRVTGFPTANVPRKDAHKHSLVIECPAPADIDSSYRLSLVARASNYRGVYTAYSKADLTVRDQELLAPSDTALCTMVIRSARTVPYMAQWLKYHLSLGFDQILVYVEDRDPSWAREALADFLLTERVRLVHFYFGQLSEMRSFQLQQAQEQHCLYHSKGKVTWMGHNDVDEYFQPRQGDLKQFLSKMSGETAAVSVKSQFWMVSGSEAQLSQGSPLNLDLPCDIQCKQQSYYFFERQKLIMKTSKVYYFSVHTITSIEDGAQVHEANPWNEIRLNHFKSIPSPSADLTNLTTKHCQQVDTGFRSFCKDMISMPLLNVDVNKSKRLFLKMAM